jgi:hypothetical protein
MGNNANGSGGGADGVNAGEAKDGYRHESFEFHEAGIGSS